MNRLSIQRRTAILAALCEGNSVRATSRLTGAAKGTVLKLLAEIGHVCAAFHDQHIRRIEAKRVQCDEIWSFVGKKQKHVQPGEEGAGDLWTWVAMDQDSKLAISWLVGNRGRKANETFLTDLAERLATRVQLTSDGHHTYPPAVEAAFGWNGADYAILQKKYAADRQGQARYSPPRCTGAERRRVMGRPVYEDVTTSHIERQNLTMRMQMRRFTRLTNGYSKKVENHVHAVALYFMHYNFCRPHHTLTKAAGGIRQTPAMAAGLTRRVWTVTDLLMLLPSEQYRAANAS